MAEPTGITKTDVEIEEATEDADAVHFETDETVAIEIGESAGNTMYVEADQFVGMSVDGTQEVDPMTAMQNGINPDDERVVDQDEDDGTITMKVNEASIFVSNDEGEVGGGVLTVKEATLDEILDTFVEENL